VWWLAGTEPTSWSEWRHGSEKVWFRTRTDQFGSFQMVSMKSWVCLLAFATFASTLAQAGAEEKVVYYVQLIHGNDEDRPPTAGAQLVGPKLSKSLHSVFRWKNYWEVRRQEVSMVPGLRTSVVLSKERRVEIDLSQAKKRKVTALSQGNPVCTSTQPTGKLMTIIGADQDTNTAWFIVVRRDKPAASPEPPQQ